MPQYTRNRLQNDIQRNMASLQNVSNVVAGAVLEVMEDLDLRSMKRRTYLSPSLNDELFDYQAPADLKGDAIIDIRRVEERERVDDFVLCTPEYFDRVKEAGFNQDYVAVEETDFLKKLRISADVNGDDAQITLHNMDSATANGTWAASGDASNLTLDSDVYAEGEGALNFDMGATYTSGTLTISDMDQVDISDYELGGSVYVWVWIPDTDGLTGFDLRIGSSASAYFPWNSTSGRATVTNENLAFSVGWNLLRFDFTNADTEVGTTDMDNVDYIKFDVIGDGSASASTDWRVDFFVARRGVSHDVVYYTEYGWQDTSGTYKQETTATTDFINVNSEEYRLIVLKGKQLLAEDLHDYDRAAYWESRYTAKKMHYEEKYPSERLLKQMAYRLHADSPQEEWLRN